VTYGFEASPSVEKINEFEAAFALMPCFILLYKDCLPGLVQAWCLVLSSIECCSCVRYFRPVLTLHLVVSGNILARLFIAAPVFHPLRSAISVILTFVGLHRCCYSCRSNLMVAALIIQLFLTGSFLSRINIIRAQTLLQLELLL
jgi:hypothetical protein